MDPVESLFLAMYRSDVVEVQRALGHDPSLARAQNGDKLPALHFARFLGHTEIVQMLIAAGPPLDVFESAALGLTERVEEALAAKPELLSALSRDGFTVLHLASYYGAPDTVRWLLAHGADPNAVTRNFLENMPIHAAASGRHGGICAMLLEAGADVNARQHGGFTPLHTPAHQGEREIAEMFLQRGADPTLTNDEGKTPADVAASQGNIGLAALLRAAAARA